MSLLHFSLFLLFFRCCFFAVLETGFYVTTQFLLMIIFKQVSQFVVFVPMLVYDERRIKSKRNFCLCCIKHKQFTPDFSKARSTSVKAAEMMASYDNSRIDSPSNKSITTNTTTTNNNNNNKNNDNDNNIIAPTMTDTISIDNTDNSTNRNRNRNTNTKDAFLAKIKIEYVLTHYLVPILSRRLYRWIIIIIFLLLFTMSIISLQWLKTETDVTTLVPDDSFVLDYIDLQGKGFGAVTFSTLRFIIENRDFSENKTQIQVGDMIDIFENNFTSDIGEIYGSMSQWVDDFDMWLDDNHNITAKDIAILGDSEMYYDYLQSFANDSDYKTWDSEILYNYDDNDQDQAVAIKATTV